MTANPQLNSETILRVTPADSEELRLIVEEHIVDWFELFSRKNREYQDGAGTAFVLGAQGQFSDMYRKMMKLKKALWDHKEHELTSEGVDEILMDLIGHCFLTLEMRRRDREAALVATGSEPILAPPGAPEPRSAATGQPASDSGRVRRPGTALDHARALLAREDER